MAVRKVGRRPLLTGDPDYKEKLAKIIEEDRAEAYRIEEIRNGSPQNSKLKRPKLHGPDFITGPEEIQKYTDGNIEIIDTSNLIPAKAKATSSGRRQTSSSFKVINTPASGKRLVIKTDIVQHLGTEEMEVAFDKDSMILAAKGVGIAANFYTLRPDKKNYVLYNIDLVVEITDHFQLDFDGITTIGLEVVKAGTVDGANLIKLTK